MQRVSANDFRAAIGDLCDAEIVTLMRMLDEGEDVLACDRLRRVLRERVAEGEDVVEMARRMA